MPLCIIVLAWHSYQHVLYAQNPHGYSQLTSSCMTDHEEEFIIHFSKRTGKHMAKINVKIRLVINVGRKGLREDDAVKERAMILISLTVRHLLRCVLVAYVFIALPSSHHSV